MRLVLLGLFAWPWVLLAQPPERLPDLQELLLEDATRTADLAEDADRSQWSLDELRLAHRPVNLNRASVWQLLQLPGATRALADSLVAYRSRFGPLASVYELQAIPGFSEMLFEAWLGRVTVSESPLGPFPWAQWQQGSLAMVQRVETTAPSAEGYRSGAFSGSNVRSYTRATYNLNDRFRLAVVAENDAGEAFGFSDQLGTDFLSGHVFVQQWGRVERAVLGDYHLQLGQGLLFARLGGIGRGAGPVLGSFSARLGLVPSITVNENQALRGAAAEVRIRPNWSILAFASHRRRDATTGQDSLGATEAYNLSLSGLHRTASERERRGQLSESMGGAALRYHTPTLQIEWLHTLVGYSPALAQPEGIGQATRFSGSQLYASSVGVEAQVGSQLIYGEVAYSNNQTAGMLGVLTSLDPRVDLAVQLRWLAQGFETIRGYAFTQGPSTLRNEQGLYLGLYLRPHTLWRVQLFADVFQFPGASTVASAPRAGAEGFLQVNYRPQRYTEHYLRLSLDRRPDDPPQDLAFAAVRTPGTQNRVRLRLHTDRRLGWRWYYRARFEASWARLTPTEAADSLVRRQRGWLVYAEASHSVSEALRLSARLQWFQNDGGASRIFAYEQTPPTQYRILGLSGRGLRSYFLVQAEWLPGLTLWAQAAVTAYTDRDQIGSGVEALEGSTRVDVSLQVRYRLGRLAEPR